MNEILENLKDHESIPGLSDLVEQSHNNEETMIDYLRRNQRSFDEEPFNPVDSLVLSSIVYLNFDAYAYGSPFGSSPIPLIDVIRFTEFKKLTAGSWMKDTDEVGDFLTALCTSRRYKDLAVMFFANEISEHIEKQFSAATFKLDDSRVYIAFRGTDGTLTGWKEDFNLGFKSVIPSQQTACLYLSGVLSALDSATDIIIGGHSKGGNLAEFAALCISETQYDRITKIFNHDGPSFLQAPSPRIDSDEFQHKLHKTVPESSIFGLILENRDDFHVVQSTGTLVFQHNPVTWIVSGNDFLYQESLNKSAMLFDQTLDKWLKSCTKEQRECFIDTVFDLLTINDAKNWDEYQDDLFGNIAAFVYNGVKLDKDTKEIILHTFGKLGNIANETVRRQLMKVFPWLKSLRDRTNRNDSALSEKK